MTAITSSPGTGPPRGETPRALHVISAAALGRLGAVFRHLAHSLAEAGAPVAVLTDAPALFDPNPPEPPPSYSDLLRAEPVMSPAPPRVEIHPVRALSGWRAWNLRSTLRGRLDRPLRAVHLWDVQGLRVFGDWTARSSTPLLLHASAASDVEAVLRRRPPPHLILTAACRAYARQLRERPPALGVCPVLRPAVWGGHSDHQTGLVAGKGPAPPGHALGLISVGRFDREAGLNVLLDAAERLRARGLEHHLAIINLAPVSPRAYRELSRRRLHENVSLLAGPELWERAMTGADACIVPACQRELCLAPLLAMALGKVVIASRDQLADWFIEDETFVSFPPGSGEALAACVAQTAEGHPTHLAIARSAAAHARAEYGLDSLARNILELERSGGAAGGREE